MHMEEGKRGSNLNYRHKARGLLENPDSYNIIEINTVIFVTCKNSI